MTPRRQLTLAVLVCVAGAAVALLATGRGWVVEVTARPAPLPDQLTERTGGDLRPWLTAVGWVALAGAGALLATRGVARRVLGGLLVLAGAGIAAGAGSAAVAGGADPGWPALAAAGGVLVAAAGVAALLRSRGWPAMGARYERAGASRRSAGGDRPEELWDALDQGEDPTAR